jgi:hypothetical protein
MRVIISRVQIQDKALISQRNGHEAGFINNLSFLANISSLHSL